VPSRTTDDAVVRGRRDVAHDAVACSLVMTGPKSLAGSSPGPTLSLSRRRRILSMKRLGDVAHGHDDADGHAAFPGRAVAGVDGGVGGDVQSASGSTTCGFLAPPSALDPFAVRRARQVHVTRYGRRSRRS